MIPGASERFQYLRLVIRDMPAPHEVQVDPTTTREGKEKEPRFGAPADLGLGIPSATPPTWAWLPLPGPRLGPLKAVIPKTGQQGSPPSDRLEPR